MKNILYFLSILGAALFFASIAVAEEIDTSIANLVDGSEITLSGRVYNVGGDHYFVLSAEGGNITVIMPSDKSPLFKVGDNVTATGVVHKIMWGIMGNELHASNVELTQRKQVMPGFSTSQPVALRKRN